MDKVTLAWGLFGAYLLFTIVLALKGMQKTKNFSSFALGQRDMGPWLVGITLASSIASSATFVINPGFVYTHGLSALFHFAVASPAGFLLALFLFSKKFRQLGEKNAALTLPQWIQNRYGDKFMGTYFALLNLLLSITFMVLIVKGSALVMQHTLGLGYVASLVVVVGVVFSYILLGGTYAHAYTNAFQGVIMAIVAGMIFYSGLHLFGDGLTGFLAKLESVNPNLAKTYNPESSLYSNVWEVFVCSFMISMGLVCQPHILMKPMYLKTEKMVNKALWVSTGVSVLFASILLAGLYARMSLGTAPTQDAVMAVYITEVFSPFVGVVISVALLAAGMSTLDGILVGASTIAANDLVMGALGEKVFAKKTEEERQQLGLKFSRYILVALGVGSFFIALNPPKLVGLFAQAGIYGLTAASLVPIAGGIFFRHLDARAVFNAAVVGPLVHFAVYFYYLYGAKEILNPAVSASIGIAASIATVVLSSLILKSRASQLKLRTTGA